MATVPRRFPVAPFAAPSSGDIEQRLAAIAEAINRGVDLPTFSAVRLRASDGSTWQLHVNTLGALITEKVV